MSIDEIQNEIIQEFELYDEWMDKYKQIIEMGAELPELDRALKTDENIVKGCQANVWLNCEYIDGKLYFKADSDAIITKGLIALLLRIYSGQSPDDILNSDLYSIDKIKLKEHLSPNRANGLSAMYNRIKMCDFKKY